MSRRVLGHLFHPTTMQNARASYVRWTPTGIMGVIVSQGNPIVEFIDRGIECIVWPVPGRRSDRTGEARYAGYREMTQEELERSAKGAGFGEIDPLGRFVATRLEKLMGPYDVTSGPVCNCRHSWSDHQRPIVTRKGKGAEWRSAECKQCPCAMFVLRFPLTTQPKGK